MYMYVFHLLPEDEQVASLRCNSRCPTACIGNPVNLTMMPSPNLSMTSWVIPLELDVLESHRTWADVEKTIIAQDANTSTSGKLHVPLNEKDCSAIRLKLLYQRIMKQNATNGYENSAYVLPLGRCFTHGLQKFLQIWTQLLLMMNLELDFPGSTLKIPAM